VVGGVDEDLPAFGGSRRARDREGDVDVARVQDPQEIVVDDRPAELVDLVDAATGEIQRKTARSRVVFVLPRGAVGPKEDDVAHAAVAELLALEKFRTVKRRMPLPEV